MLLPGAPLHRTDIILIGMWPNSWITVKHHPPAEFLTHTHPHTYSIPQKQDLQMNAWAHFSLWPLGSMMSEKLFLRRALEWEWTIRTNSNERLLKVTAVEHLIVTWKAESQVINDLADKLFFFSHSKSYKLLF